MEKAVKNYEFDLLCPNCGKESKYVFHEGEIQYEDAIECPFCAQDMKALYANRLLEIDLANYKRVHKYLWLFFAFSILMMFFFFYVLFAREQYQWLFVLLILINVLVSIFTLRFIVLIRKTIKKLQSLQ